MVDQDIFKFEDYKEWLRFEIDRSIPKRGAVARMAKFAGCQSSYLSQVLNSHVHLTVDHLFGILNQINYSDTEMDYILMVHQMNRSADPKLKRYNEKKLRQIKNKSKNLSHRLKHNKKMEKEIQEKYYNSYFPALVHIMTSIPKFQTVESIARYLNADKDQVKEMLIQLEKYGLINKKGQLYVHSGESVHLPKTSPWSKVNHNNWRSFSKHCLDQESKYKKDFLNYSSIFTLSESDVDKLKNLILDFLKNIRSEIVKSDSEIPVVLLLDYFSLEKKDFL